MATLDKNASKPPLKARTGVYHTHAASTVGALVARYCGGRSIGRSIGRYAVAKITKINENDVWIASKDRSVTDVCFKASSFVLPLSLVTERVFEKNTRRVSSIGWNTMRAMREPEEPW